LRYLIALSKSHWNESFNTHQAPTGIFTGPLEDKSKRLIQPAVVLMNLMTVSEMRRKFN
jgi:hypothetical protein